jgi:large subunit ribosomal protein L22
MATETTSQPTLVRAQARYVRTSARKARLVLEHVRGKPYAQARAALQFSPRAAARDVLAVLDSAGANAEANLELVPEDLVVESAFADEGPTAKRWRPRARGRAARIRKRTCHITIVLRHDAPAEERETSAAQATLAASRRRPSRRRQAAAKEAPEATAVVTAPAETEAEAPGEAEAPAEETAPKPRRRTRAKAADKADEKTTKKPGAKASKKASKDDEETPKPKTRRRASTKKKTTPTEGDEA